jgi:uncharacterized RDD family membrane protein YckC
METEETLIIETPERVSLHFALASIGNRFLACAIDHFLQILFVAVMFWAFYAFLFVIKSSQSVSNFFFDAPRWATAVLILGIFLITTGYFVLFEWAWNGQTPGKRWLKLRVIRQDGRPITFWESAARNILRIFDMLPSFPFYSIGLISVFVSAHDQRIGDFFAGTVVVREREAEAPSFEQVFNAPTSDSAYRRLQKPTRFDADLSALTEREIEVVEAFLRRRADLNDFPRQWMAWRVAMPIIYKLKPDYDLQTFTYEGFLEELLHRYRAQHRFKN